MRDDDIPQHFPAFGTVKPRRFDLIGGNVVQAGKIQDHHISDLRPQTRGDDAVIDVIFIRQHGNAGAGYGLYQDVEQAKVRGIKPREHQADDDLRNHEGKEEQRFVDADAAHGLVQENRHEQTDGNRQHEHDQPDHVVAKRCQKVIVLKQFGIVAKANPGRGRPCCLFCWCRPDRVNRRDQNL